MITPESVLLASQSWVMLKRDANGKIEAYYAGHPLDMRHDLRNHSPDGPNWGYCGSGPAQLSLAILAAVTGDDALAQHHYQQFKREIIAAIPHEGDAIPGAEILRWLDAAERARPTPVEEPSPWENDQ